MSQTRQHFPAQDSHGMVVRCPPNSAASRRAVSPGEQRNNELTLEIPGSDHPGPGLTQAGDRPSSVPVGRMTPRWGRGHFLLPQGPRANNVASQIPFPLQSAGMGG